MRKLSFQPVFSDRTQTILAVGWLAEGLTSSIKARKVFSSSLK